MGAGLNASNMAVVAMLRTWPGTLSLCASQSGIASLVKALQLDPGTYKVTNNLLALLFEIFHIPLPPWSNDFTKVLDSMAATRYATRGPQYFRDSFLHFIFH